MPFTQIRLDAPNGIGIYGKLSASGNKRIIVHAHGLTHHSGHYLEVTSSEFFEAHAYDHYAISFSEMEPDARKLHQCSMTTFADDLALVLSHFKKEYDEVFLSTHSISGLVALTLNPQGLKAISMWDPSTDVPAFWIGGNLLERLPERHQYIFNLGNSYILSEEFVDQAMGYADSRTLALAATITTPTQFLIASDGISAACPNVSPERYKEVFKAPFDLQTIENCNHIFSNRGNRESAFEKTLAWFDHHSTHNPA